MDIQRQQAVRVQRYRTNHVPYASFLHQRTVYEIFFHIESEIPSIRLIHLIIRVQESRMSADLEMHRLISRILHTPKHLHLIALQTIPDLQKKRERIGSQRVRGTFQRETQLVLRLIDQRKIHIPCKAVLRQRIHGSLVPILGLPYAPDDREQYRGMTFPESGVRLPEILLSRSVRYDTTQLRSMFGDTDR